MTLKKKRKQKVEVVLPALRADQNFGSMTLKKEEKT